MSKDLPPAHAAFAEPLSCALHGLERADITFNDVVVVAGCGPIGLGMIAGSKAKNARLVIGLDMSQAKLELAKQCGADVIINIGSEDAVAKVKELTDGYGADVYLEGTGHPSAVGQGLNLHSESLNIYDIMTANGSPDPRPEGEIAQPTTQQPRPTLLSTPCWSNAGAPASPGAR